MSSLTVKALKTTTLSLHLLVLGLLLSPGLATGETPAPKVLFPEMTATDLSATFELGCPDGSPGTLTSLEVLSADSEGFELPLPDENPSLISNGLGGFTILPELTVGKMCDTLRKVVVAEGSFQKPVTLDLVIKWTCGDDSVQSYTYPLAFTLLCGDVSEIHAPSTTDPGPPTQSVQFEVASTNSLEPGVAFEQPFGEYERQLLRVFAGIREPSEVVPVGEGIAAGEAALATHSVIRSPQVSGETRIETDLKLVPVDVSYGFRLLPPDRPVVPTVYAGAGYVFADVDVPTLEGEGLGGVLHPDLDALQGRDESGFTLNAGFSVRFNLRPGGGGKYLYLGARSRWYAKRDADETDEEVFFGLGLPVCHCGGR